MKDGEMIRERIKDLEETIKLLKNKEYIEARTVCEFLRILNINFSKDEVKKSKEEPIDVIFCNCNFQVKAIYDEGRRMLKEYKDDLAKAKQAANLSEALNFRHYTPVDVSIQDIVNLIDKKIGSYILSSEQYQKINLLFYYNKIFHGITDNLKYVFPHEQQWKKWRSVSMVKNGGIVFIFWANDDAVDFIKMNIGKVIFKT